MTARIEEDPVVPLQWPTEQRGMQGGAEIPKELRPLAEAIWRAALNDAQRHAKALYNIGETAGELHALYTGGVFDHSVRDYSGAYVGLQEKQRLETAVVVGDGLVADMKIHKSIPNRIVEPWMWMTVVMTATEWNNFFRLRCHPDAEIHFQKIAGMIRDALAASVPVVNGGWHRPFIDGAPDKDDVYAWAESKFGSWKDSRHAINKISAARCARVSYLTHDGEHDPAKDLALFDRLSTGSGFGHWSPMEHVAKASLDPDCRSGPFVGWHQFRKDFDLENEPG
jgi:hypothetical protein